MKALALACALVLLLTGATCQRRAAVPVPAQCNAICFSPCVDASGDTGIRWEADPNDPAAFDALGGDVTPALSDKLRTCDKRREACVQCLRRLDDRRVIRLGDRP